jgi:Zn finger protein HypA/HybF involved in hydrogenase expression
MWLLGTILVGTVVLGSYVLFEKRINQRRCPCCGYFISIDALPEQCPRCGSIVEESEETGIK